MPVNIAVSTDAKVAAEDKTNTKINTGGTSSNNQVWRVQDEDGKSYFVQTRLNRDGSRAYLIVKNQTGIGLVPYVLATVSSSGELTYGGSGGIFDTEQNKIRNSAVTSPKQAKDLLNGGSINDVGASIENQLKLGDIKADVLAKSANSNNTPANQNPFIVSQRTTSGNTGPQAIIVEPFKVIPSQAIGAAATEPIDTGESPLNNDPKASNGAESIGAQLASAAGDTLQDVGKFILEKSGDINDLLRISDQDIAKFEKIFEAGGGDKIEGAKYPLDANYGDIRGQDYVTIDQFIYQPPRRDQILGIGSINPLENLSKGQQRISSLKKFVAMVKLPMPNNITDSNNISWGDDAMNNLSATLTSAVMSNPVAGAAGGVVSSLGMGPLGQLVPLLAAGLGGKNPGITNADGSQDASLNGRIQALAKMMEQSGGDAAMKMNLGAGILGMLGVNVTPESLLSRGFGVIPNSNSELLFNNVTLRDFQFSWRMSPRDEKEALEVKRIIRFFKQGMAAKTMANQAGQRSLYLGAPNIFRLQYRTAGGQIIEGVNRIKPCAVTGTAVNYTPDGQWSAYDKGQPVSCTISIQMKELEPVYATDYSQQVIKSRRSGEIASRKEKVQLNFFDVDLDIPYGEGDLYSIRPNEVGY